MRFVDSAVQLSAAMQALLVNPVTTKPATADDDGNLPAALRNWLVQLRLLQAVPFAYLVPDSDLLPEESIRWFYLDRRWTDALVMGTLSVGTVNSDDRTLLASRYDGIRDELDSEERQVRRPAGADRLSGDGGPISGFLLRSRLVSGWPAIHVRGFAVDPDTADDTPYPDDDDPSRLRVLRLERLAPAVLLCLFDGIPETVHIEEPRQGVQFGFDATPSADGISATLRPRNPSNAAYVSNDENSHVDVPFRASASGVVNIEALAAALPGGMTDSAAYALQLIRFPYRQVWGEEKAFPMSSVFHPTVSYQVFKDSIALKREY